MRLFNYLVRAARIASAPVRALPGILIIGGIRCGTTSLWDWLSHHPELAPSSSKEVHYLDINSDASEYWYRAHFGFASKELTYFEATPSYMATNGAARQAAQLVPDAAIVALLREPAERAWSHYRLRSSRGDEPRTFSEVVDRELEAGVEPLVNMRKGVPLPYLTCGLYADQLTEWRSAFGRQRLFLVDSDEMFTDPNAVITRLERFLDIEELELPTSKKNAVAPAVPDESVMARLREFYQPANARLGSEFGFSAAWV